MTEIDYPQFLYFLNKEDEENIYPTIKVGNIKKIPVKLERVLISDDEKELGKYRALIQLKNEYKNKENIYLGQYFLIKKMPRLTAVHQFGWSYGAAKNLWFSNRLQLEEDWWHNQGLIGIYKCIEKDVPNANLININKKTKETRTKRLEILKNSKKIDSIFMKNKRIYLKRDFVDALIKDEINKLGINLNKFSISVSNVIEE